MELPRTRSEAAFLQRRNVAIAEYAIDDMRWFHISTEPPGEQCCTVARREIRSDFPAWYLVSAVVPVWIFHALACCAVEMS